MLSSAVQKTRRLSLGIFIASCILLVSWNGTQRTQKKDQAVTDTVPSQEKIKRDIDFHLQQLQKAMSQLDEQLQHKNWEKVQKDVQESLNKIDMQKINQQFDEAMKNVDFEKIKKETEAAINKVDFEKMQQQMKAALRDAENSDHFKEAQKELKQSMAELKKEMERANVDYDQIKQDLEKAKQNMQKERKQMQVDMERAKQELQSTQFDMQKELTIARNEIAKAKEELTSYKTMITEMEKDGLIKSDEDYEIEFKNGKLSVNGKQQSKEVADKYRKYIKKESVTIKNAEGNLRID